MSIEVKPLAESYDEFADWINTRIDAEAEAKRQLSPLFHYAFQACDSNRILGGVFGFDNFGAMHIEGIWVDPEVRREGVGQRLIDAVEDLARKRGCKCLTLFTMDFQAVDFYKALGYAEEFRRTHYHSNSHAIYMIKVLRAS